MPVTRILLADVRRIINTALDNALVLAAGSLFMRGEDYDGDVPQGRAAFLIAGWGLTPHDEAERFEADGADVRTLTLEIHVWVTAATTRASGDAAIDEKADVMLATIENQVWVSTDQLTTVETERAVVLDLEFEGSRKNRGVSLTLTAWVTKTPS